MGCTSSKKNPVLDRTDYGKHELIDVEKRRIPIANLSRSISTDEGIIDQSSPHEKNIPDQTALISDHTCENEGVSFKIDELNECSDLSTHNPKKVYSAPPVTPHPHKVNRAASDVLQSLPKNVVDENFSENDSQKTDGSLASDTQSNTLLTHQKLNDDFVKVSTSREITGKFGIHPKTKFVFAGLTKPGFDKDKGQGKVNQDVFDVCFGLKLSSAQSEETKDLDEHFMAWFMLDGHGPTGDDAANFALFRLLDFMARENLGTTEVHGKDDAVVGQALHETFLSTNKTLESQKKIDISLSGTTAVVAVLKNKRLYIANVGDSRAVLGRENRAADGKVSYSSIALTEDHKPDLPAEHARIIKSGGRVFSWGVARVWLKDKDLPGLAMSRSLGDKLGKSVGVIPDPEVTKTYLEDPDKFLILATDGIWEFIKNREAVHIVGQVILDHFPQGLEDVSSLPFEEVRTCLILCCETLIHTALERWEETEESIDDCTVSITLLAH
eukprot:augustus_masked-scaffold_1-processed-gene-25.60-mRNA-1 protein AED:0.20 eAED:0.24 QI:0/-1/0/1/-1/1/1/0/497